METETKPTEGKIKGKSRGKMYDFILANWAEHCLDDLEDPSEESIREVYEWLFMSGRTENFIE